MVTFTCFLFVAYLDQAIIVRIEVGKMYMELAQGKLPMRKKNYQNQLNKSIY